MTAILQNKSSHGGMNKIELNSSKIEKSVSLAEYTTFAVGGKANYFCLVQTREDLNILLKWCKESNLPFLVIGNGSNLLISEEGFPGLVIKLGKTFKQITRIGKTLIAGAAVSLPVLLQEAKTYCMGGVEPLAGIPGTVGGAVITNAGTKYGSTEDIVSKVTLMNSDGLKTLPKEQIGFSYRRSGIDPQKEIITEVEFYLSEKEQSEIDNDIKKYIEERRVQQPWGMKSAGCIFKNPPQGSAAKFIEDAGLKGFSKGGAEVSEVHANFIVNTGEATSNDILELIQEIQGKVHKGFGILLEPEIKIV